MEAGERGEPMSGLVQRADRSGSRSTSNKIPMGRSLSISIRQLTELTAFNSKTLKHAALVHATASFIFARVGLWMGHPTLDTTTFTGRPVQVVQNSIMTVKIS